MSKQTAVMDIECYRNFFLIGFKNVATGNIKVYKAAGESISLSKSDIADIRKIISGVRIVTFNGINYDFPMMSYALSGASCTQLKDCSDDIIVGQLKFWHIEKKYKVKVPRDEVDHIDTIHVAFGQASLKMYGGRIHAKTMRDLPFDPAKILTAEDRQQLEDYWKNDLDTTIALFNKLQPELALRESMTKEYGIDLRSKSDAQIAEAIIKLELENLRNERVTRPGSRAGDMFSYQPPVWIKFETSELQTLLEDIKKTKFVIDKADKLGIPSSLEYRKINIGNGIYRLGIGGLHSSEEKTAHYSDDEYLLIDADVESYYPRILISQGLYPQHLGNDFLKIYKGIFNDRVKAKQKVKEIKKEISNIKSQINAIQNQ